MMILELILALNLQDKAPEAAELAEAEKTVRELFKADFAKKAPNDKLALGEKLLQQARQAQDSPATQFVLFREAQDSIAQGGGLKSLDVIDEWGRRFQIDAIDLKVKAILNAAKQAKTPEHGLVVAAAHLQVADAAGAVDRFDVAEKQAQAALAMGRKATNVPMVSRATAKSKELAELKTAFEKIKKAREVLSTTPEDPEANLAVGKYQCLAKGNWESGLPHLAKGSDPALKELATKDLANPALPDQQSEVGDGWWDASTKLTGPAKERMKERAISWYDKALPLLQGLGKVKADQRVSEHFLGLINLGNWVGAPTNTPKPGDVPPPATGPYMRVNSPPSGSECDAVSVRYRATGAEPGIFVVRLEEMYQQSFYISFNANQVYVLVKEGGSEKQEQTATFQLKEEHLLTIALLDGDAIVYLDGREKFRIKTELRTVKWLYASRLRGTGLMEQQKFRKKA